MKTVIGFFLVTSFSGTLGFLFYMLTTHIMFRSLSAISRYRMLKVCLCFFLVPFTLIWHVIRTNLLNLYDVGKMLDGESTVQITLNGAIVKTTSGIYLKNFSRTSQLLCLAYLVFAASVLTVLCIQLLAFCRQVRQSSVSEVHYGELLSTLKAELHVRKQVGLYRSDRTVSPFTYGLRKPAIILTDAISDDEQVRLALMHELIHIRSNDFLFRFLAYTSMILHFFNPAIYFFVKEFTEVQELACDEFMLSYLSADERHQYGTLLIQISSSPQTNTSIPIPQLSGNRKKILRRRIMKIATPQHPRRLVAGTLLCLCLLLTAIPVFAYSPYTLDFSKAEPVEPDQIDQTDWVRWQFGTEASVFATPEEAYFSSHSSYFIADDGTVYFPPDAVTNQVCSHSWVNGTYSTHKRDGAGCTVTTYSARYCLKCHQRINIKRISTTTYDVCPHKS